MICRRSQSIQHIKHSDGNRCQNCISQLISVFDLFLNIKLIYHSLAEKDAVILNGHQERIASIIEGAIFEKVHADAAKEAN